MNVSLIYHNQERWLCVTHQFVLGKGISCAQIYDDIYNGLKQKREPANDNYFTGDTARNRLINNNSSSSGYDPALAVLVVLKKTLCDWLQNFLKLSIHTKSDNRLGFSIAIQPNITINANNETYVSIKDTFDDSGIQNRIPYGPLVINDIRKVLSLNRTGVMYNKHYICIPNINPTTPPTFLLLPYTPGTKLFTFIEHPVIVPLIGTQHYIPVTYKTGAQQEGPTDCYVPRFHLFNYINIFWDKYRSVYSPDHYRYISTLPSLSPITTWKPDFCITGDILDLWISFILTKITLYIPPVKPDEPPQTVESKIIPSTSILNIPLDPFIDRHIPVHLTNSIVVAMSGGATKINLNNRRKRKISYSNTKRKLKNGISKRKTKKSNQKKSRMKKSSKNHKKNKMNSKLTKKKYNK
jgi:hypothetical protein